MTTLKARIEQDINIAMKAKDQKLVELLRFIKSKIQLIEIEKRVDNASNVDVIAVLQTLIKQHTDSKQMYIEKNVLDRADNEQYAIDVMTKYLPQPLSEQETIDFVTTYINGLPQENKNIGFVMKYLRGELIGRADMSFVSNLVKEQLA